MSRVLCVLGLISSLSAAALAQQTQVAPSYTRDPEITTNGHGEVRLAPDYAYVTIGVTTQNPNATQTASQNAAKVTAILSALHSLGLTDQQATTSGYNMEPTYEYPKNQQPRLAGYTARNTIRAEVRRLDDLGRVIDAAINAGATNVSSVQYLASSTDQARQTALLDAVKHARADAEVMARGAGGRLGRLLSVSSLGVVLPVAMRETGGLQSVVLTAASGGMPPTPINPAELTLYANVATRWEFLPAGATR